ncbi:MAG: ThuA domain-containing protein [Saprospiraceae bacterium]|nr:ThuA domain-containing protein [Saprospiraceae bacterium]
MKRAIIILGILGLLGFIAFKILFAKEHFVSVLVFSKTESFRHDSIDEGKAAIIALGKKHGFQVDTSEDASIFKEVHLQKYNVVVFLNTTGDILDEAQQLEFNRFIQAGGGFVGIHSAVDTEYDWPWYGQLVGAYFNGHPNDPNVREADIQLIDGTHESTSMLPEVWHRSDEWYNLKDIQSDLTVLLNLDETTYEGGTNGESHPIAWHHEFDGGRAWYTGLGHTPETFSEPLFLEHLLGGINYAAGPAERLDFSNANVAPEENRFIKVVLENQLDEPMELEMLPDGKLLFVERKGAIRLFDPAVDSSTLIQQMEVSSKFEDGLLGLALDPKFEENNWIYLFYSDPEKWQQNIARFTMAADYGSIDMASEKVLLEVPTQREECCHSAGSMEFGPDGLLYVSLGDNTNPHESDGFSPSDERTNRGPWDAQKSSANTMDLRGKILRIKPEADGTYSIPSGNLFAEGSDKGRPEIYVMGCRNPFRISVDQRNGYLYWGEVGPDAGRDSLGRGPRGYDEVNQAKKAGFYGWPYFIANNQPYNKYDFAVQASFDPFDPEKPINQSPNNTGARELPPTNPAFIWYPYGPSSEFPLVGDGGRNAMAGPVFYVDDYPDNPGRFPGYYDGKLFIYDWMRGWIMAVTMDEEQNFKRMERFMPSYKFSNPTDIIMGPNGDMYMLEYGTIWFSDNPDARLVHIQYNSGNRKPVAQIDADQTVGALPLAVNFSAANTKDFDGDELTYEWYFDGDDKVDATDPNPSFTFEKAGEYKARLVVTDPSGESAEASTTILAGNAMPDLSWDFVGNRSFYWDGQRLDYEVMVKDAEDGQLGSGIDPKSVTVSIDYLERGYDANESAIGHQAMQEASLFILGQRLIEQSDCSACHQKAQKSVGPSYLEVAQKYQDDANAVKYLANKIITGGGGVWGEIAMAAHPQLSDSEAEQMSKYILSLAGDAGALANNLGTKGSYIFDQHESGNPEGKYIFRASYQDKGGKVIGPLVAQEEIVLKSPTVLAADYALLEKSMRFTLTPEQAQGMIEEDLDIVIAQNNGYVMYSQLDMTGVKGILIHYLKAGAFMEGGKITFRVDAVDGPIIAEVDLSIGIASFGEDKEFTTIEEVEGVHDLYVTFSNTGEKPVTGIVSFYFDNQAMNN